MKNGYNPPRGNYSLKIPYSSSFQQLTYKIDEDSGKFGAEMADMFFPIDSICLAENSELYVVEAIKYSKIAEKLHKSNILAQNCGYIIIKTDEKFNERA